MTIIFPMAILALVALAVAVFAGVKGTSHDAGASQRLGLWAAAVILALIGLAAGFCAWWAWRFSEEFTF